MPTKTEIPLIVCIALQLLRRLSESLDDLSHLDNLVFQSKTHCFPRSRYRPFHSYNLRNSPCINVRWDSSYNTPSGYRFYPPPLRLQDYALIHLSIISIASCLWHISFTAVVLCSSDLYTSKKCIISSNTCFGSS